MSEKIVAALAHFIIAVISASGYWGVLLLMAIESACIPLPSEIIMPFAGYLVHAGRLSLVGIATAGALGCNLGSALAYWIGARGGRPFISRYGRFVLLNEHDLDRAERFAARAQASVGRTRLRQWLQTNQAMASRSRTSTPRWKRWNADLKRGSVSQASPSFMPA